MSINLNNYEIYFIDYFDGNLSEEVVAELMLFLERNPELKEEFESFDNIKLEQEEILYPAKSSITKAEIFNFGSITEDNYEDRFIANFEDDLNSDNKNDLEGFLKLNPSLAGEFEIHRKLKLPVEEIVFKNKNQLYRKTRIVAWNFRTMATAASIALLLSVYWFLNEKPIVNNRVLLELSATESRNVLLMNNVEFEIADRGIKRVVLVVEPELNSDLEKNKHESISFLRNQGDKLALTGDIECAKLLKREVNSNVYYASVDRGNKKSSLFSKIVSNNSNKLANALKPSQRENTNVSKKDPALVKFIQGSVTVFNTITGSEVEQFKVYDEDGNLTNYQLDTQLLTMNKNFPAHITE